MHYVFCDVIGSQLSESQSHCKTQNASLYLPCIVSIFMKQNDRITDGRMNDCVVFFWYRKIFIFENSIGNKVHIPSKYPLPKVSFSIKTDLSVEVSKKCYLLMKQVSSMLN